MAAAVLLSHRARLSGSDEEVNLRMACCTHGHDFVFVMRTETSVLIPGIDNPVHNSLFVIVRIVFNVG